MRTGLLLAWFWRRFLSFALIGHVHNVHDRESVMMGLADRVIAVSNSVATSMERRGIPASKIRVVLNRILGSRRLPSLSAIDPAPLAHPAIVTVGGMTSRKGIEELISAFESIGDSFRDAHLYLVGDGAERQVFEKQAQQSKHSNRIHFEGFQAIPQSYMLSADVFVLASRRESFGLVLTEAREAGCAIVATDVDGIAEALDGGHAGMLVPARNVEALAGAIVHMLGDDKERKVWRCRARRGIEAYSVDLMAAEVRELYEELVSDWRWRSVSNMVGVNGS
jgi:glycosyltransferase involved in cell wall biosynthesis